MLVALNAKESVDWDRLRIAVRWLFLCRRRSVLTERLSGQGTRLPSRKTCQSVERKADGEGRSASAYESKRKTTSKSPCPKNTLAFTHPSL